MTAPLKLAMVTANCTATCTNTYPFLSHSTLTYLTLIPTLIPSMTAPLKPAVATALYPTLIPALTYPTLPLFTPLY